MRAAVVAFTRRGAALGARTAKVLGASLHVPPRLAGEIAAAAYASLAAWTAEHWSRCEALIFVGACGIAVRAVASHVRDKFTDPAVVVLDEGGQFAIPLLSGHMGGANDLARALADLTGAQAVITTATDVNGCFAVDLWARERDLAVTDRHLAREISAAVLEGKPVGFASDFAAGCPPGLSPRRENLGIFVTCRREREPFPRTLRLAPRCLILGIGCRRGTREDAIAAAVDASLWEAKLEPLAVKAAATIELKAEEPGLLAFCRERDLPLRIYSAGELAVVPGTFTPSSFVRSVTGVDNVCERAAAAGGGMLLLGKRAWEGVTVAIALENPAGDFPEPGESERETG